MTTLNLIEHCACNNQQEVPVQIPEQLSGPSQQPQDNQPPAGRGPQRREFESAAATAKRRPETESAPSKE